MILVRGMATTSAPSNRRQSRLIPSIPELFFFFICSIVFLTFVSETVLREKCRFLFFTFSCSFSIGSFTLVVFDERRASEMKMKDRQANQEWIRERRSVHFEDD